MSIVIATKDTLDATKSKLQDSLDEAKSKLEGKLEEYDREKLARYIDHQLDFALRCAHSAEILAEEAKLAFLDAMQASRDYAERYGDED